MTSRRRRRCSLSRLSRLIQTAQRLSLVALVSSARLLAFEGELSTSTDSKVRVWSTEAILDPAIDALESSNRLLFTGTAHNGSVMCVRFSSSGRYFASGADDNVLAIWELQDAANSITGTGKVWNSTDVNVEVWKPVRMLRGHENDILSVAWSDDDAFVASGGADASVLVWDGATFAPVMKLAAHTGFVRGLVFDPVGQYLASQADDRSVKIWDTTNWSLTANVTDPFVDAPNDSANWFTRPSYVSINASRSFLIAAMQLVARRRSSRDTERHERSSLCGCSHRAQELV